MWYDSLVRCGQGVNDPIFDGADFIAWTNLLSFPISCSHVGPALRPAGAHGPGNLS